MTFAVALVVKATMVLVAGLIAASVFRRAPASIRHVILASTFGALISMPLYETFGPSASFVVPIDIPMVQERQAFQLTTTPTPTTTATAPATAATSAAPGSIGLPSLAAMIAGVWAVGATLLTGSLLLALWRLNRLTRRALPWLDVRPLASALAAEAGLRRPVHIVLHEDVAVPLTWGLRRPVIILPMDAREWIDADVRCALLHEMEHVYRGDWLVQLAARTTRAIYWFHPLAWTAMRKLSLEAERACDDAVVRSADRTAYADQLVSLAERLKAARHHVVPAMASRSDLSTRVRALLDERQKRGRPHPLPHAVAIGVMCVTVLTIGPVRAVERTPVRQPAQLHEAPWAAAIQAVFGVSNRQSDAAAVASAKRARERSARMVVRDLISRGGSANVDADSLKTASNRLGLALIEAAEDDDIEGIDGLIAAGVDVNAAVDGDGSPLIAAARGGHLDAVHLLLDRGADVDMAVPGDGNPLLMAASEGHTAVVGLLLMRGADVDMAVPGDGNPLIMAASEGHIAVVELLLSRGASIDMIVDGDENALIQASGAGRLAVVQLLVSRGADVNARAWAVRGAERAVGEWRTPLSMAMRGRHTAVVNFLRSVGARE